jgi:NaMN:DMB phosphoribosyltransferase
VAKDAHSDIAHILSHLSYIPHAIYTEFSFANAEIPVLKKYDEGEAKEGVGAGGALAYACANGLSNEDVLNAVELIMYEM